MSAQQQQQQQQQQEKSPIVPRAAVSVVVKFIRESEKKYVLVQRGKEPNKVRISI